jgi:hypothetical protein
MRHPALLAVLLGLSAALLATPGTGAVAPAAVKTTGGWIEALTMDRGTVAYGLAAEPSACHKVIAWYPLTRKAMFVSGKKTGRCGSDEPSGMGIEAVGVAGRRVAWIRNITGNTESYDTLYTATLPKSHERRVASAVRTGDTSGVLTGEWIGGLVSDGESLFVSRWHTDSQGSVTDGSLNTVGPLRLRTVIRGPDTVVAFGADGGRIAVLRPDGTIALYATKGAGLRTFAPPSPKEVALRKDLLVVLTKTQTLVVYNANTGALLRTWPVPDRAWHLDVHSGVAVYSVGRRLHALRLATGKDVVIVEARRAIVDVEIEAPGLVYAFNTVRGIKPVGNLAFLPMRRVVDAVS